MTPNDLLIHLTLTAIIALLVTALLYSTVEIERYQQAVDQLTEERDEARWQHVECKLNFDDMEEE